MSDPVVEAEEALQACLVAMRDSLEATLSGALPQTHYDGDEMPDTLRQRLVWEQEQEYRRLHPHASLVRERVAQLKQRIAVLGGGVDGRGQPVEVPVEVLDRDIELLAAQSAQLGAEMVALYDRAERLAVDLGTALERQQVPSI